MNHSLISASKGAFLAFFCLLFTTTLFAQNQVIKCHTTYVDSVRHAMNPDLQTNEEFEEWLAKEIQSKKKAAQSQLIINGVYQIPVIVHVIHNGEAIGTGTNITAAAIQSQIDVLNEDFRKLTGTPGDNTHPDGADTQIEFCLARRRPDGTAFPAGEDGINRVNRNTVGWTAPPYNTGYIDGTIKPYTIATQGYDAADYMNFWSVDISGGILGYAQFPTTILGGMGCGAQSVNTDGVVMAYASIGKSAVTGFPGPYNEGRTATHEIGHWLGLRHIWGDGGCGVDDYCNDTPLSDGANFGCANTNSCADPAPDPNDMVENYMDYSDDLCMNIFTYDQKMRMRTVLENSPIRASLITSDACIPPAVSDASIVNVLNPLGDNCPGSITPNVTLRNRGSSNLTSATIEYTIDGGTATSFAWTGTILPGNEVNVSLPAFTTSLGIHTFKAYSLLPNTVIDPDPIFDTTTIAFAVSNGYQPNHSEDFEIGVFPPDVKWTVVNPNSDCVEWVGQACTSSTGVSNNVAALMTNYNNGTNQDEYLYTPIFILPCNATSADLSFDYAYKKRINGSNDRLRVEISEDCGTTWNAVTIFDQSGNGLVTSAGNLNAYWIPSVAGDWGNQISDLTAYVTGTSKNVQFRFRATNAGNGGNLYVDNVQFNAVTPGEIEVTVSGLDILDGGYYDFGSVPIGGPTTATFTIDNPGTSDLILTGPISIVGDPEFVLNTTFGTTTVPAGGSTTFTVDFTPTGAGPYSAILSFGTNDCDEAAYDFELLGTGNVTPPVAAFTYLPATICEGSTVTYTDASTGATGWTWTFPNGTPNSATGVGPHVITYNTAGGPYDAQLDVTNAFGSDTDLQSSIITVIPVTGIALPITEGFVGVTFPPVGWAVNNGGIADTWIRDAANGNAPTAGNSAVMDNFNNNTSGNEDDLVMPAADFTGLISAQLQFDVAYARYSATYNDQLQVLVSNDCGQTYSIVYDKASTVLATDPDQTAAYTPATWRQETIDLSAYVGSGKVDIMFKNIGGWGQFLYIDNINLTGVVSACDDPDVPTITYTPATICDGDDATLTIAGNLDDATDWFVYTGSCGGTSVGSTNTTTMVVTPVGPSTTYYIRGEGGCVVPGTCGSVTVTVDPIEDATFSYGSTAYCADASDPIPTITGVGSGTFTSAPAGLSINALTGVIDVSASTPNSYTVTYTTPGTCTGSSNVAVTINATPSEPTISASGPTTFCDGGSVDLTSSQATGNVWSTGETTQTINVTTSGSYTVIYTDGNGCSSNPLPLPLVVSVLANPAVPTISADGPTTFCTGGSVNLTSSQASGNVWSTSETTQTINVASSGNFSVTYTDGFGCSSTSAITAVTLNANPAAPTVLTSGATTFCAGGSVDLTSSQGSGNVWSTTETTQTINVTGTGSYSVTYTDGNGCSSVSAPVAVTVNANPSMPTISADGPTTFCTGGSVNLTSSQASGNVWTTTETTQTINVAGSGNFSVTYTDGNGCSSTSAITAVTLNANPTAPTISASGPTTFCAGGSVDLTSSQASGNVWSTTETTQTINVTGTGNYSVIYTDGNGCSSTSALTTVTVNTLPTAPTISTSGPTTFCAGGSVTLTSSQGSGNVWSTSSTSNNIIVNTGGPYSVTYTDGNGCSATSLITTVTVNPAPVIAIGTVNDPSTCATNTGSIQITGTGTGVVSWTGTATANSGSVSLPYTITGLAAGSYNITFDDGCGSNLLNQTLTDPTPPTVPVITAGGPTTFCAGGSVTLTSSYGSGNTWSTTETTPSINVGASSTVSVTYTDGFGCSSSSAPILITVNALPAIPTVSPDGPTTFCSGGSVNLSSSQATGNVWSTTETTQIINVSTSGPYSVTYTDGNGCSSTSAVTTITVNVSPSIPTVSASGPTTFCAGGSVDLTSSQATGIVWSTTETTQMINASSTGSFSVTYTAANGCSSTSAVTNVTVNPIPVISIGGVTNPSACSTNTGSVIVSGSGTAVVNWTGAASGTSGSVTLPYTVTNLGAGSYSITVDQLGCTSNTITPTLIDPNPPALPSVVASGATTFCAGGSVDLTSSYASGNVWSTTETTQSVTVTSTGSYTVTYTDGSGCSSTSAPIIVTVNANPATPTISASGSTAFCSGGSVDLTSSQASGNVWSTTETAQVINITGSGSYTVTYTDGNGCSATSLPTVVTVNVNPNAPTISASGSTTFCAGGSVDLISSQASGNVWSTTETVQSINVTGSGSYTVTYTDGNGCSATSSPTLVTVNANPAIPTISASGPTTFCAGGSVDLTSSQASGNLWSTTETLQSINVTGTGSYTVTYTDGNGCSAISSPTIVTVNAIPAVPTISANGPTTFCIGGSVDLTSSQASGNVWSTTETLQSINVTGSGSYTVTYTDINGCSATSIATDVVVNPLPTVTLGVFADVCDSDTPFTLTGGTPAGGTYSGSGVTASVFDPSMAGIGTHTLTYTYVDGNGCSNSSQVDIIVNDCAGINEVLNTDISIYPNPTFDFVNIVSNEELIDEVKLYDAAGRLVNVFNESSNEIIIDLSNYPSGIYNIEIRTVNDVIRTRVLKQ